MVFTTSWFYGQFAESNFMNIDIYDGELLKVSAA